MTLDKLIWDCSCQMIVPMPLEVEQMYEGLEVEVPKGGNSNCESPVMRTR